MQLGMGQGMSRMFQTRDWGKRASYAEIVDNQERSDLIPTVMLSLLRDV